MENRIKYYLLAALLLVAAIVGYHYLAANQAEKQITKALKEQTKTRKGLTVQFTSVDVTPFTANVTFKDLSVHFGSHVERAETFRLDINYFDFLNIYFGGLEYGLEHLYKADILVLKAGYLNREGLEEIKMDTLMLTYSGNAMDAIRSSIAGIPFQRAHQIEGKSSNVTFSVPGSPVLTLKANTLSYSGKANEGANGFWLDGNHRIRLDALVWTPSKSFQNSYRFFIEGFGFPVDAIPFEYFELSSKPAKTTNALSFDAALQSDLALISSSGLLHLREPLDRSRFRNAKLTISDFSKSFNNVLVNVERFFSIDLPRTDNNITLDVSGTIAAPAINY